MFRASTPPAMDNKISEKYVITIGRQMGSGGRMLGRIIADRLGIAFYDKELLMQAAQEAGLSPEFFERNDERRPQFVSGLLSFNMGLSPITWFDNGANISDDALYKAQCDFIHRIAAEGPCVIVGRSADYVLRDLPNVINLFVHANPDDCARRVLERDPRGRTLEQCRSFCEKTNKLRANFYNFYTDKRWGDAAGYDLCFNSSTLSLDHIADLAIEYLRRRLAPANS